MNIASSLGTRFKAKEGSAAPARVSNCASLITEGVVPYDRIDEKTNGRFLTVVDKHG